MSQKSEHFEKTIHRIHELIEQPGSIVTWNDKILDPDNPDQNRQIDITIKRDNKISHIECRIHKEKQDVKWVEELIGRRLSLNADLIIAVSASGFTNGAIIKAEKYGVILRDFISLTDKEIQNWGRTTKVWLTFYQYFNTSIIFKVNEFGTKTANLYEASELIQKYNMIYKTFDAVKNYLNDKNYSEKFETVSKVRYRLFLEEKNFEDIVIDEIVFESKVGVIIEEFETPAVCVYDNPLTKPLDRDVFVEKINYGNSEITQSSGHVSAAIDLSDLHLPENTQFNTIRFDFVDPVSFDYIYFLGLKKLSIQMDEMKIGIEYSDGL